jgi:3-phenylpropionate/trans-cinnamate dioxygenase ferredoxin subunit
METTSARWVYACRLDAFDKRQIVTVTLDRRQFILVLDAGRMFAAERACPHEGADLALGRCSHAKLHCPRHAASFDLTDGSVSPGWSFPALRVYPVRAVGSDLWIDLGRQDARPE